jgi:prephenate dehydrogenase
VTDVATGALSSVLVVGTGLIGTSVALALRAHGVTVYLTDRDPQALRQAVDLGAGDPTAPPGQVDLAVVAIAPSATASVVSGLVAANAAATVIDTCGVKADILRTVRASAGGAAHFVGTHPMAGRERSGPLAARGDLFEGHPWVIVPDGVDPGSLARTEALVALCGGVPVHLGAAEHDVAVALVSHVPQVAASLVAARLADGEDETLALTGQGLRDTTRVAASDPDLWVEVLAANAEPVARILDALRQDVDHVISALHEVGVDPEWGRTALREALVRGNAGRARLPGKHGGRQTPYVLVPVVLPDRPGELARLFATAGEAGVNIEDVAIEHSPGQPVGLVELSVAPGAEQRLADALTARGWQVHA